MNGLINYLDLPAVRAALADLHKLTKRSVRFEHVEGLDAAELRYTKEEFLVQADGQNPLAVHALVHELCHAIMFEEGYPLAVYPSAEWFPLDVSDQMSTYLTNQFHHSDVFRRMAGYGLDMTSYMARWDASWARDYANYTQDGPNEATRHLHVWLIYPWFFMGDLGAAYLHRYSEYDPGVYAVARRAYQENGGADGFSTPARGRATYEHLKRRIMEFCCQHDGVNEDGVSLTVNVRLFSLDDYLDALAKS